MYCARRRRSTDTNVGGVAARSEREGEKNAEKRSKKPTVCYTVLVVTRKTSKDAGKKNSLSYVCKRVCANRFTDKPLDDGCASVCCTPPRIADRRRVTVTVSITTRSRPRPFKAHILISACDAATPSTTAARMSSTVTENQYCADDMSPRRVLRSFPPRPSSRGTPEGVANGLKPPPPPEKSLTLTFF